MTVPFLPRSAPRAAAFAACLLASFLSGTVAAATPGTLDTGFGTAGKTSTNFSTTTPVFGEGRSAAVQADGKIVVCGASTEGTVQHYALLRYNPDGTLDATFGTGGIVRTLSLGGFSLCSAVAIQPSDQKIVAAGFNDTNSNDFVIVRYNTNGTLDSGFATGGVATIHFGTGQDRAQDVVIQSDGKIVAAGWAAGASTGRDAALVRLTTTGALDTTFGGTGRVTLAVAAGTGDDRFWGLAIDSAGRIVAVGQTRVGSDAFGLAARFNSNGSLDTTFNSPNGHRSVNLGSVADGSFCYFSTSSFRTVAIAAGDRIVAAGDSLSNYHPDPNFGVGMNQMAFFKFNADGTSDATFGPVGNRTCPGSPAYIFPTVANTTPGLVLVNVFDGPPYNYNLGNSGGQSGVRKVVVNAAGKVIGLGYADTNATGYFQYAAVQLNANGTLDAGFSGDGKVATDPSGLAQANSAVGGTLDASGRPIVVGYVNPDPSSTTTPRVGVVRYTTAGALDTTFNSTGIVFTQIFGGSQDHANAMALQADGKAILAGSTYNGSNADLALARYTTAGALDVTFGSGGKVVTNAGANEVATAVKLRSDGLIYAAGQAGADLAVFRYTAAGVLDTTFGTSGIARAAFTGTGAQARALALQADNKVVAGGINYPGGTDDAVVVRFTAAGALDSTFGTGGKVTLTWGSGTFDEVYALALQADGKVVVAGRTTAPPGGTYFKIALARLTDTGALDATFGTGGRVVTSINTGSDEAYALAIQPDGKIVVGGKTNTTSGTNDFFAARYNANGTLDTGFGSGGSRIVAVDGTNNDAATGMLLRVDGKIVLFGSTYTGANEDFAVALLTRDGAVDTSFGTGGKVVQPILGYNDYSNGIAITADGQWVLGGEDAGPADFLVAKMAAPAHEPTALDLAAASDSGASSTDDITNDTTPTINGTCFHGETVTLTVNGSNVAPTQACASNDTFGITLSTPLTDGVRVISGFATSANGDSTNAVGLSLTIDTIALPPAITTPAAGSDFPVNGTVAGNGAENGATVTVAEGPATLCTATANASGAWSCAINVAAGAHTIVARQLDIAGNTSANSASVAFTAKHPTTTAVISSLNPSTWGASVTFTATTTGGPAPTGLVQFKDGATNLGSPVALVPGASNSTAALPIAALATGSHSITVEYPGSATHLPSTSSALSQTVNKAPQTIDFTAPAARDFGTAPFAVSPSATSGLGVTLASSTTGVCTVAGYTVTLVAAGNCTLDATQAGDVNYLPAAPVSHTFAVNVVAPGAPVIGVATAGNGQASIAFTAPAFTGGAPIASHTVTCTPTGTATGPSSPLVVTGLVNGQPYDCSVTASNGTLTSPASATVSVTPVPPFRKRGDANLDNRADFYWRDATGGGLSWWTMNGATVGGSNYYALGPEWTLAEVSDQGGDGKADITWRNATDGSVTRWNLDGLAVASQVEFGPVSADFTIVGSADLDGDGHDDLVFRHADGSLYGWLMGPGIVAQGPMGGKDPTWRFSGLGDFDGDGKADILWHGPDGTAEVWLMDGLAQTGGGVAGLPSASFWTARAVADFDGDGKADVLWIGTNGDAWVWLMDGVAKKSQGSLGIVPAGWSVAAVGDFNGDGKADIAWRFTDGSGWLWTVDGLAITAQGPFANPGGTWQLVRP